MSTQTTHYGLEKPDESDYYNINVQNGNMDKIDAALHRKPDLDESGKVSSDQLPDMDYLPLEGGTMTGPLTLNGNPTEQLHAVPKKYVDDIVGSINTMLDTINGEVI